MQAIFSIFSPARRRTGSSSTGSSNASSSTSSISDSSGVSEQNGSANPEPTSDHFIVTPNSIEEVRSLFTSLPPEIITPILDYAQYWAKNTCARLNPSPTQHRNCNTRYLTTLPLSEGHFRHPLRQVVITTVSKDQGWSSDNRRYHGTREASWTWFELTLESQETGEEKYRTEIVRNIHAGAEMVEYRRCINDPRLLELAEKGDTLSVWVRAMFPGWVNYVSSVVIETFVAY